MKILHCLALAILTCAVGCNPQSRDGSSRSSEGQSKTIENAAATTSQQPLSKASEGMRKLRQKALTSSSADFGLSSTLEYPKVYGALAEFPMDEGTLTIVSFCDGNASLYTTGTLGVIGGFAHEPVRNAATKFVKAAQDFHGEAVTTNEFPYPKSDRVRFYLLTFDGVRFIDTDLASLEKGKNKYSSLFAKSNDVITELRKIATK